MDDSDFKEYYRKKISGKDKDNDFELRNYFREQCLKNKNSQTLSSVEILEQEKFFGLVHIISMRYPFVFLPSFIQDWMAGWYSSTLLEKYHFRNYVELAYLVETILKIKGKRTKVFRPETLIKNLKNIHWKKIYDLIIKNSSVFKDELTEILNQNILRAFIIFYLYEKIEGVTKNEISNNISEIVTKHQSQIKIFSDKSILDDFLQYIKIDLDTKIDDILHTLLKMGFIQQQFSNQSFYIDPKYASLEETIIKILGQHSDGLYHDTFHRTLLKEIPLLKLVPKVGLWESAIGKLEKSKVKRIEYPYWKYRPYRDQLFTQENFDKKIQEMKKQVVAAGKTRFFGRQIEPNEFVLELEELEKGDLDDTDDQVTRLAGLVLAGSILLQTPHENLKEFDFAVDVSNFEFSPEQIEAMQRADFAVTGKILHSKVMIGETVELSLIDRIKEKLPSGEQAVIFTFGEIPEQVRNSLPPDKSIQIVDKKGILSWTSITPVIPCRVGSIAKVMYGDQRGKIVQINTINYRSGLANVTGLVGENEWSVYIGMLQEIWFGEFDPADYYPALKNYYEFLSFLSVNTVNQESFEKVLFEPSIESAQYTKYEPYTNKVIQSDSIDVKKDEKYSPFENSSPNSTRKIEWKIKVSDVETKIIYHKRGNSISFTSQSSESSPVTDKIRSFLKCECIFFNEQSHSIKLCSHIIAALDFLAKKLNQFDNSFSDTNDNLIKEFMLTFQKLNKDAVFDYVSGWFSDDTFYNLIKFIKNLPRNNDLQPEGQPLLPQKMLDEIRIELLSEFGSTDFRRALSEMESTIVSMNEDEVLKVTDVLECRYLNELSKSKDFDRMVKKPNKKKYI